MPQAQWTEVDAYLTGALIAPDGALEAALKASAEAGLPAINVAPNQGRLLELIARSIGARRILEIGTLGGYSTIWLARALPPGGRLVTLEYDPRHAEVAKRNIANAGFGDVVDIRIGRAVDNLPKLEGPFDFIFVDADKASNPDYFAWALKLSRVGSVIVVDNVVRGGAVIDASSTDPNIVGIRRMNALIAAEPRVAATAIQTVGSKGYDGLAMLLVVS